MVRRALVVVAGFLVCGGLAVGGPFAGPGGVRMDAPFVTIDPIVDGADSFVSPDESEWADAAVASDGFLDPTTGASPGGLFYYQVKDDWTATSATGTCGNQVTYPGPTFFIAHDIFGAPTGLFSGFRSNDAGDWNYVKVTMQSGTIVECWNFGGFGVTPTPTHCPFSDLNEPDDGLWLADAGGLGASSLIPEGAGPDLIDDRGFIVRRDLDPATDVHWFPGDPEPGDGGWDWSAYHGCFARAGFNQTFQDANGPDFDPLHDFDHECYEWAFHDSVATDAPLQCFEWRIVWIDPPKRWIVFFAPDFWIHFGFPPVPALPWAAAIALALVFGVGGFLAFRRRRAAGLTPVLVLALAAPFLVACGGEGNQRKDPPRIQVPPWVPKEGWIGRAYTDQIVATGQSPPFTFTLAAGSMPPGLNLGTTGTVNGTPTQAGTFPVDIDVTDATNDTIVARTTFHVGDGPVPPNGQIPIELVSLSLRSVSPIVVVHRDSTNPNLNEAFGVVRIRGGDPTQPYQFQCLDTGTLPLAPPNVFLFTPNGTLRYKPGPATPAGQHVLQIQVTNLGQPTQQFPVTVDVQVP
jgi:hypothetical protein